MVLSLLASSPGQQRHFVSISSGMYGALYDNGVHRADDTYQALKISRISCHEESKFGHDFLWVNPLPWTQLYTLSTESFYDWPRHSDFAAHPQRFMAYIPLHKDGSRLYGFTAFCSSKGLVGLGTHFHSSEHSPKSYWHGEQKGCPVHVQFGDSETVSLISVFWHKNDPLRKPYLAVGGLTGGKKRY
jgi:hypothetical protein